MSVQRLDTWADKYAQTLPLSSLETAVVGVDASYYLDQCLNENTEEPLKVALGGIPFCLTARIEEDLQAAKEAGLRLVFIFDGLDYVNKSPAGAESAESRRAHEDGWKHYIALDPQATVQDFGKADYPLDLVLRHFRKILSNNAVDFLVAPFSSLAWLAYLYHMDHEQPIDAIMASTDAFLFDVDKIISRLNTKEHTFTWLQKTDCVNAAGHPAPQIFREAQLLLGSRFLPPFPPLDRNPTATVRDAVTMLGRGTVLQLCHTYREDPAVAHLDYADRYKKAVMTIKHHVIMTSNGSVQPLDLQHAPGDVHAFVGRRLPDELFFYMSRGMIAPQVPNWLTTNEIKLTLPGGVMDCEPYRRFVIDQLNELRLQSVKLLSESLHNYWISVPITVKSWDGRSTTEKAKDLPALKDKMTQWIVQDSLIPQSKSARVPTILSCLRMLKDKDFAQKTVSASGKPKHPALKSQNEILSNVFWRFLHVRGFVDDKHQLTTWGHMLEAALSVMDGGSRKEEQGIIAVELLRFGAFNTLSIAGVPVPSSDKAAEHKKYTNLVSKIACLGRLKHVPVGYVGPLDRSLLTFAWEITAIRESLRNLCETILTAMFLQGNASRERDDWQELSQRLPFISDNGSSLGIAVKTYLDALDDKVDVDGPLVELKEKVKSQEKPYDWFHKAEDGTLYKSLETAFKLFDAVHAAVKAGDKEVKDAAVFASADQWLTARR